MAPTAVIFDMGGILGPNANYAPLFARLPPDVNKDAVCKAYEVSWKQARDASQYRMEDYWRPILESAQLPVDDWVAIDRELRELFVPWWQMFALVDKVKKAGFRVGILSNHIPTWFDDWFSRFGLATLFEEPELVCISARMGVAKPEAGIYERFCAQSGLQPSECVFIDDKPANVEAAKALGWTGIDFLHRDEAGGLVEPAESLIAKLRDCGVAIEQGSFSLTPLGPPFIQAMSSPLSMALKANALLDFAFVIPGFGGKAIGDFFKKSATAPSENLKHALIWGFLLHGFVRGHAGVDVGRKAGNASTYRLALLSYAIEALYFFFRIKAGQCHFKDVAAAILIASVMSAWMLSTTSKNCPGFSLVPI